MSELQFRVLYRQFLFRMVDLELLSTSAHGDVSKLLGQFAALLIFVSMLFALAALDFRGPRPIVEHLLISTNMLAVGLLAVLSWESTFPDRRDVLVLAPLPVRARTIFTAKVAAVASALGLTIAALNALTGIAWPPVLAQAGFLGVLRSFAAYWIAMLASGAFVFCSVLTVQGLAALLPRRRFLRLSAFLQMAAFCLFVSAYFMNPSPWLPSVWFVGLFNSMTGSPVSASFTPRALIGLAASILGAATAFLLSYFRTLRKIIEEPDILPGSGGRRWLPRFGNSLATAIVQFSIRTLLRSRQHRVMFAFYVGIGFAFVILFLKTPRAQQDRITESDAALLFSTVVMMCVWVVGARVVFSMPLALRANWIFRVTEVRAAPKYLAAIRRPLFVLAVAPVWTATAVLLLSIWPWRRAAGHLILFGLWGVALAYICLRNFQKIPFTCSYRPGKSYLHMAVLAALGLLLVIGVAVRFELQALADPAKFAVMFSILSIAAFCARWSAVSGSEEAVVQFEDLEPPAIQGLGLTRDGVTPLGNLPS